MDSFKGVLLLLSVSLTVIMASGDKIDADLRQAMSKGPFKLNVIVTMGPGLAAVRDEAASREYSSRAEKLEALNKALRDYSENDQKPVIHILEEAKKTDPIEWKTIYISNQVIVKGVTSEALLDKIAGVDRVDKISMEKMIPLH